MDGKQLFPTSEGTPQGGVISPLLANIAVHGMENRITQAFPKRKLYKEGEYVGFFYAPNLVRYADDFVIFHEDITVVQRCKEIISEWLKGMGLELKPSKTRLAHTLEEYEGNTPGFDFLGFNIRQFSVGKYHSGKNNGKLLGFKTIITPSQEKQKIHHNQVVSIIDAHKTATQKALIGKLNPIIRGWANYYSTVVSKEAYTHQDYLMYQKLIAWAKRRHPHKLSQWIVKKYWKAIDGNNWVFATRAKGENLMRLRAHGETPIVRHVKVKGESSPYDGNLVYWSTRMGKHPEISTKEATLLKRQKGKCNHCGLFFRVEIYGKSTITSPAQKVVRMNTTISSFYTNTATMQKQPKMVRLEVVLTATQVTEEPDEGKLSRPVL